MVPKSALFLTALAAGLLSSAAQAAHFKLFVLTGQSNSLGTTAGGEADPSPGSDPADAKVKLWWSNLANAATALGDSGGAFTTLQSQQGGYYSGSATHWGPEIAFSRTLYRAGVRDFGIIKASRGGGGNSFWLKNSADHHMYDHVVATVNSATATLTAKGDTFEIVGLLYLQGESDTSTEAAAAGARLQTLVDNLRVDLPNAAAMHCVAGGIGAAGTDRDTVRANQSASAATSSSIDAFGNLDLQSKLYDSLHFNKAAKLTVGERFAQAFFAAGTVARHYGALVFMGDSITQGGNGDHPSYRYAVFKHLANCGVPVNAATGYQFAGSVSGPYLNSAITTPAVNGQTFDNLHDGHYGWRAAWECGRVALPAGRYGTNNLGSGTLLNWTGQAATFVTADAGTLSYTGGNYLPDTAVIMLGINDLADGTAASQVRDDLGTMIDQLRAANPNVRIHLNKVLHTNQGATRDTQANTLNGLLPALVAAKNAASATSPVWLADADTGFNPVTQTYDTVHPNASGETYVGDRIAAALGLVETPASATFAANTPPHVGLGAGDFTSCFEGNEIWNGSAFLNSWTQPVGALTKSLPQPTELRLVNPGSAAAWIEGTATGWSAGCAGSWTVETRLKFTANANGFVLWLGTGTQRIIVEILGNATRDNGNHSFSVSHNNLDGAYHTFRVAHDAANANYHVWRDSVRLTPLAGVPYDTAAADSRLIVGDYTSGTFGNNFDATIDHLRYDLGGGYLPPDADFDADGLPDAWEYQWFGSFTTAVPGNDDDSDSHPNLQEFRDGSNPWDAQSYGPAPLSAAAYQTPREISRFGTHELLQLRITNPGTTPRTLQQLTVTLPDEATRQRLAALHLLTSSSSPSYPVTATPLESLNAPASTLWTIPLRQPLPPGTSYFWLSAEPLRTAPLGSTLDAAVASLMIDAAAVTPSPSAPSGSLTLGLAPVFTDVRASGEAGVNTYRIPGIVCDAGGVLHAVYDLRYNNSGDLPANIDVGYSRSTDGGATWTASPVILDYDSAVAGSSGNGVGDPCILFDPATHTLWVAALWSFGNHGYTGSGAGTDPTQTGQYVLTKSTDAGLTWSAPINITTAVKDDVNWRLIFQGPGHGLAMRDGSLVFPSQRIDANGVVQSCSVFSADHGTTWDYGSAVTATSPTTNENTACELDDGRLLFSMRTPSGSNGQRAWAHYTPGGAQPLRDGTWSTLYRLAAVPDPVCQGSVIQWTSTHRGHPREQLLYVGPGTAASRTDLTLRLSGDGGASWPVFRSVYAGSAAYSSMCILPDNSIGILFERDNYTKLTFVRIEPDWIFNPAADADADGLPDAWESFHNVTDPAADDDGDGRDNLSEYASGTDPRSAVSLLRATGFQAQADGWHFAWQAVPGRFYQVESSDDLVHWSATATRQPASAEGSFTLAPTSATRAFVRARAMP
jgi:sialidase-1